MSQRSYMSGQQMQPQGGFGPPQQQFGPQGFQQQGFGMPQQPMGMLGMVVGFLMPGAAVQLIQPSHFCPEVPMYSTGQAIDGQVGMLCDPNGLPAWAVKIRWFDGMVRECHLQSLQLISGWP